MRTCLGDFENCGGGRGFCGVEGDFFEDFEESLAVGGFEGYRGGVWGRWREEEEEAGWLAGVDSFEGHGGMEGWREGLLVVGWSG